MKLHLLYLASFLSFNFAISQIYEEKKGYVVMEAESTSSPLDKWQKIQAGNPLFIQGASGGTHLEFTGNQPSSGPPTSPLTYTFKINTPGTYKLMIRSSKRLAGQASDKCNDCYVKMTGDFTSGHPVTDPTKPTTAVLKEGLKFFGGSEHPLLGWAGLMDYPYPGKEHNLPPAWYDFKAGQTYTITLSGRSQRFNMDYFVLFKMTKTPGDGGYSQSAGISITPTKEPSFGVDNFQAPKRINIFPNPASNIVRFSEAVNAIFYNVMGQKVLSVQNSTEAKVSNLPRGVYIVKINNKYTQRVVFK